MRFGQFCPNPVCDYVVKDFIDLSEEDKEA